MDIERQLEKILSDYDEAVREWNRELKEAYFRKVRESEQEIIDYVDGLEKRVDELEARLNPPSCMNCKYKLTIYSKVPCLDCRGFNNWEAE